jgi:hypothetical protein
VTGRRAPCQGEDGGQACQPTHEDGQADGSAPKNGSGHDGTSSAGTALTVGIAAAAAWIGVSWHIRSGPGPRGRVRREARSALLSRASMRFAVLLSDEWRQLNQAESHGLGSLLMGKLSRGVGFLSLIRTSAVGRWHEVRSAILPEEVGHVIQA